MNSVNSFIVSGRLGRDVEVLGQSRNVAKSSIAVSSWSKATGEQTIWIDVVAFEKTAEIFAAQAQKGSNVLVEGRLDVKKYEKKDGTQGVDVSVIATRIHVLSGRREKVQDVAPAAENPYANDFGPRPAAADLVQQMFGEQKGGNDDIPF
jgi:single-strand DNA-binding protein